MYGLVVMEGRNKGAIIPFREDVVTIGRSPDNTVVVDDRLTSKSHAEIARIDDRFVLKDLSSKNGTYINGRKVQEHQLQIDDEIKVGATHFRFADITQTDVGADATKTKAPPSLPARAPGEKPAEETVTGAIAARLETLKQIVRDVVTAEDPIEILKVVVRRFLVLTQAERGSICLLEEGSLKPFVTIDHDAGRIEGGDLDPQEELAICHALRDRALKEKTPQRVENASEAGDLRTDPAVARVGIRSILVVPVVHGERVMGAVYLDRVKDARPFGTVDADLVEIACHSVALYLEHALYA